MENEFKFSYDHCVMCDSYETCADYIVNHPELVVKCIHFGLLQKHIVEIMESEN